MSFKSDFLWGTASAAAQFEGAYLDGGLTPSIWDNPAVLKDNIAHGETPHEACDHYHRFKEDIELMRSLGLKSYRFSVSWSRVMPHKGQVNPQGISFYRELVETLRSAGIEPIVTLYHWDLPLWVHEEGGWENEQVVKWFCEYVNCVVDAISDMVTWWITFNEMQMFIGRGYISGINAPFLKTQDPGRIANLTRNVMLSHGEAVKIIRQNGKSPTKIGMAPTGPVYTPLSETEEDINKAYDATFAIMPGADGASWWMDPIVLGRLPEQLKPYISGEDLKIICQPLDFYGFNVYQSRNYSEAAGRNPAVYPGMPRTAFNWPITPEVMYWSVRFHYERYRLPVMITENGMANTDFVMEDGKVHDPQRTGFIRRYLKSLKRAADEGFPVLGYQYWALADNFEWAEGYDKRFGLIYVDYRTQKRTVKDSAWSYKEIIESNGENL